MARAQRGDLAARDALVHRILPGLRAFVRRHAGRRLREREEACDLVQSICREFLERLNELEFRGDAEFRLWVIQTARHKIMERARYWSRAKRAADEVTLPPIDSLDPKIAGELLEACSNRSTPAHEAIVREEQRRVLEALQMLPAEQCRVVLLRRCSSGRLRALPSSCASPEGGTVAPSRAGEGAPPSGDRRIAAG